MKKSVEILFNIIFWAIVILFIYKIEVSTYDMVNNAIWPLSDKHHIYPLRCFFILLMKILPGLALSYYLFYQVLFPNYYSGRIKLNISVILTLLGPFILSVMIVYWAKTLDKIMLCSWNIHINLKSILLLIYLFGLLGILLKALFLWKRSIDEKKRLEQKYVASETALLLIKGQLNPHFLFNTINNIDVLIDEEPQKASNYLKKLSEIMRFMLYESNTDTVPLTKEIEYIDKYLDLQKIRTSNEEFVNLEISGNSAGKSIAPLIFIHFVENAFKYTSNKKSGNAIIIRFDISETRVSFCCKNKISPLAKTKTEKEGIGNQLIKQRLELLYKNRYSLTLHEENNWYIVNLTIQLNDY